MKRGVTHLGVAEFKEIRRLHGEEGKVRVEGEGDAQHNVHVDGLLEQCQIEKVDNSGPEITLYHNGRGQGWSAIAIAIADAVSVAG